MNPTNNINNWARFNQSMMHRNRTDRFNSTGGARANFNPNRFGNQNMDTTTAPILLGVGGGLLFVSIVVVTARLWSRIRPLKRLHIDDWTVIAGTILSIANYILLSAAVMNGLGRRTAFVSFSRRRRALELLFISQVFWYWSVTLVKLSVACLLLRVKDQQRRWRIFLYAIMALLVIACIVQTLFQFLQCRPFRVFWDPRVFRLGPVKCFRRRIINGNIVAFSTVQVAVDLIFSFVPITFIRKLNRPRREKIFMCILMALGLFASCAAIIRTLTLQEYYTSTDMFRTYVTVALWAVVEQQFALIAATIPTLKAFLEKAILRLGVFFYDEKSETKVRGRLVQFGLLGEEELERGDAERERERKGSEASMGSFGDGRRKVDFEVEDMLETRWEKEGEGDLARLPV